MRRKSSGWFARLILGCKGAILVCVGGHVVRGGAQEFEIDVCRLRDTSHIFPNVINLDFRFRTRILSPSNSSGLRFSGGVLDFDVQVIQTHTKRASPHTLHRDQNTERETRNILLRRLPEVRAQSLRP